MNNNTRTMVIKYTRYLFCNVLLVASLSYSQNNYLDTTDNDDELFERPKVKYQPQLVFPEMARQAGLEATIYIKMAIGKDGKPYKTVITKREPEFVYLFDDDVRRWTMGFEFYPGINKKGEPAIFWVTVPVKFRLYDFEPPMIIEQPNPEYPLDAKEMGLEGWVGLAVLVDKNGRRNGHPLIVSREPANTKVFDDAAIDVAIKSTYKSATIKGNNTNGWIFMKVEFNILPK